MILGFLELGPAKSCGKWILLVREGGKLALVFFDFVDFYARESYRTALLIGETFSLFFLSSWGSGLGDLLSSRYCGGAVSEFYFFGSFRTCKGEPINVFAWTFLIALLISFVLLNGMFAYTLTVFPMCCYISPSIFSIASDYNR